MPESVPEGRSLKAIASIVGAFQRRLVHDTISFVLPSADDLRDPCFRLYANVSRAGLCEIDRSYFGIVVRLAEPDEFGG